ncbi:MAG: NADH-ubiquinone oxidoreductase-F iron-sulfur binding region domain-containing protein [Acidimicrobiales bacterium]
MRTSVGTRPVVAPEATGLPRLLAGTTANGATVSIEDHLSRWGAPPVRTAGADLIDKLSAAGLAGHGGAWFPVATKWRSIRGGRLRRPIVVGNGAEGEPASSKDALLLAQLPHLVLDGATLAGAALDASRVIMHVPAPLVRGVEVAIDSRRGYGIDPIDIEVVAAPDRFIAGQESAVVSRLNGGDALPSFIGIEPIRDRGVSGRPTLVQNVETLAHVALIARFGPAWFRALGTDRYPGTMLITVTGRWSDPQVFEASLGTPLRHVLTFSHLDAENYQGALLGGYGGGWVNMPTLLELGLDEHEVRRAGSSLGAGVMALLPRSVCPLVETARVVRYMEQEGAGQCGPCVNGLAGLADTTEALAYQLSAVRGGIQSILDLCALIDGRGACRHPDGVTRFVRSSLSVFQDDVLTHLRGRPCQRAAAPGFLPCLRTGARSVGTGAAW